MTPASAAISTLRLAVTAHNKVEGMRSPVDATCTILTYTCAILCKFPACIAFQTFVHAHVQSRRLPCKQTMTINVHLSDTWYALTGTTLSETFHSRRSQLDMHEAKPLV